MPQMIKIGFYVCLFLIAVFLWRKKEQKPSKLKLKAYEDEKNRLAGIKKVRAEAMEEDEFGANYKDPDIFIFKGKKLSATAVLKIPKGSSSLEIKQAFAENAKLDPANESLYFAAFKKLLNK